MSDQSQDRGQNQSLHQPPYEHERYAHYATEPWDEDQGVSAVPRVWYFFLAFVVGVILMGVVFVFLGVFCHVNPQAMLDAQAKSTMAHAFKSIDDVKNAAVVYWSLGGLYVLAGALVFFLPRNFTLWMYGIGLMLIATLSLCFAPFSVTMFVFWMLPSTRAYFQRRT